MEEITVWCAECGVRLGTLQDNTHVILNIVQVQDGVQDEDKSQALCLKCAKDRLKDRMHRQYITSKHGLE